MSTDSQFPARPLNGCRSCGFDFAGRSYFDAHRVGKHDFTLTEGLRREPPREDGRRCLSVEEMSELGWAQDKRGRWFDSAKRDRLAKAHARTAVEIGVTA